MLCLRERKLNDLLSYEMLCCLFKDYDQDRAYETDNSIYSLITLAH